MELQIFQIIEEVVTELNEELEYDTLENVTKETELYGGENSIDSISLARLITEIELQINEQFGKNVILADEKAMSMKRSPYRNVESLLNLIMDRLENGNG